MAQLERFLYSTADDLPPLVRIGLAHAQFETIHLYVDGNGRLGRLLITFLLCERGILRQPVLYLSYFFKKHRAEYDDRLQAVRTQGDWEGWLGFFLRGVVEVAGEAAATCGRILELRERHRTLLVEELGKGAANGIKLLESLYELPLTNVKAVRSLLGVTPPAANTLVARLVELGVLQEVTGNRVQSPVQLRRLHEAVLVVGKACPHRFCAAGSAVSKTIDLPQFESSPRQRQAGDDATPPHTLNSPAR